MSFFLDSLIGMMAPHECLACSTEGALLCPGCIALLPDIVPQCYRCGSTSGGFQVCRKCRSASPFRQVVMRTEHEGFAKDLLYKLKFERARAAADVVASAMAAQKDLLPTDAVFVPIPTATNRVRQRGYDQSVLIAKSLSKNCDTNYANLLLRRGQMRQTGSSRSQRLAQLETAFIVRKRALRKCSGTIVLVDDVLTTGATLEMAAKALRTAGAQNLQAIVFARAI